MPYFLKNRPQYFLFPLQFLVQEFPPSLNLFLKHAQPCLPGEGQPGLESGTFALRRPFFAFQGVGQGLLPLCSRFKHAAIRSCGWLCVFRCPEEPGAPQLFQRVVNLRPRYSRPIPYLAPLELRVCLIAVHRTLRQQAQQNQIRRRQRESSRRSPRSSRPLRNSEFSFCLHVSSVSPRISAPSASLRYLFSLVLSLRP